METKEITRQAKQSVTIFKKQLHECQCKENRIREYCQDGWLTTDEYFTKIEKLEKKKLEFAKRYLAKFNSYDKEQVPEESKEYAKKASAILLNNSMKRLTLTPKALLGGLLLGAMALKIIGEHVKRRKNEIENREKEREI